MNVFFVVGGGNLSAQIAQIALFIGLQREGVKIHLIGRISEEVADYIKSEDKDIVFYNMYPKGKIDEDYIEKFSELIIKHNIELVHFACGKTSRTGIRALKKFPEIKTVIYYGSASLHWHDPSAYLTYLHPRVDKIIGNSNFVYNHVRKQLFGKRKQKAVRIFKGYSVEWFKDTKPFDYTSLGIPKEAIVVCSIGNHRKVKGTKYFLEASNYLNSEKEIHFVLIGDNTDAPHLSKIKEKSKIKDRVHILGRRNDVPSLLLSCDMYVQSSLSEGFGRAISEAMCLGKPTIMTNAGGCTELIDEKSGIVVPLKDYKAIGREISNLANNDDKRIQMGKAAKERIQNVYSIERTVNETLALYKELFNE
ncbi:glycosyltransferase family 4 protein [Tenacibaculum jejuense]|uniref:Putative Poly(Glycerol-phosphate) alpha-glucosyltransferase n=1 Tax=Tenacibaculum jejuense TaxID=584609 RepID=A0A238UB72_9FLAO|nr:glycosyltransferase family 4 protein [Tenacibaculum jejuense]SNR15660.1 putative Poly(Glycerol-phosphate) alpha-glucosyltransferase [Tenacibaculum jejuense]